MFNFADIYWWAVVNAKDGDTIVEIDAWKGKSTAFMCQIIKDTGKKINFYTIDTFKGTPNEKTLKFAGEHQNVREIFEKNLKDLGLRDYVEVLEGDSVEMSKKIPVAYFVYLDGDHSYFKVKEEISAWKEKTKFLAGHDYNSRDVKKAVNEIFGSNVHPRGINSWLVEL